MGSQKDTARTPGAHRTTERKTHRTNVDHQIGQHALKQEEDRERLPPWLLVEHWVTQHVQQQRISVHDAQRLSGHELRKELLDPPSAKAPEVIPMCTCAKYERNIK
jgi:hypothetical protein